jgi:hypothetical protein
MIILLGIPFLSIFSDFLIILLTNKNMDKMVFIMIWVTTPIVFFCFVYVFLELLKLKKKWYLLAFILILGIIWEFFLCLDPTSSIRINEPEKPGESTIDTFLIFGSPLFILYLIGFIILVFILVGIFAKALKSKGILRKKLLYVLMGSATFFGFILIENLTNPGLLLIPIRIGVFSSFIFFYLGLREEPAEPLKKALKKEVKVEQSVFRLIKRPDYVTEEEVSISKEKKICLVCKGDVIGFNVFICTECKIFYCKKCARALSEIENACWSCGTPIDKSKPSQPFKKKEEAIDLGASGKSKKMPKKPK